MCKKCTKHHNTLLHIDADYLAQRKLENEVGKEETHVVALSVSKQVLLMTCKVKVTTADGSSGYSEGSDPSRVLNFIRS